MSKPAIYTAKNGVQLCYEGRWSDMNDREVTLADGSFAGCVERGVPSAPKPYTVTGPGFEADCRTFTECLELLSEAAR